MDNRFHLSGQGPAARWLELKHYHLRARVLRQPQYSHRDWTWSPQDPFSGSSPESGP